MASIAFLSDMHGDLPTVGTIPEVDFLVIAGDVAPDFIRSYARGAYSETHKGVQEQSAWLRGEFTDWLEAAKERATHIIGIGGNHDFALEGRAGYELGSSLPWTYLQDEGCAIDGVSFYGSPWVPNLPFWAFYASDRGLAGCFEDIPSDLDVLVTHGPPQGVLDRCPSSVGSLELLEAVRRARPKVHVFGHIHEGRGRVDSEHTTYINASRLDGLYDPYDLPIETIEL